MLKTIRTIIIDDEEDGRLVLMTLLNKHCPHVQILQMCDSAEKGIKAIEELQPDLVFLDVEMPRMNGFSMLEKLTKSRFAIIFVTAYNHYAIKAIKFSALDYLLKPLDEKELIISIEKFVQNKQVKQDDRIQFLINNKENDFKSLRQIALPVRDGYIFVNIADIVRCEGDGNYTSVIFQNGDQQLVCKTLKEFEANLSPHNFVRIHKSHLVNLKCIKKYIRGDGGTVIMTDNSEIEVSRRNKETFLENFNL